MVHWVRTSLHQLRSEREDKHTLNATPREHHGRICFAFVFACVVSNNSKTPNLCPHGWRPHYTGRYTRSGISLVYLWCMLKFIIKVLPLCSFNQNIMCVIMNVFKGHLYYKSLLQALNEEISEKELHCAQANERCDRHLDNIAKLRQEIKDGLEDRKLSEKKGLTMVRNLYICSQVLQCIPNQKLSFSPIPHRFTLLKSRTD